ncbi:thioredoxin family protein [Azonexus sp.]|uniref:thioredoxin family protein n=1 Tax=Azonexus sp. TaxID=1872668 RepID=UPI0035B0A514
MMRFWAGLCGGLILACGASAAPGLPAAADLGAEAAAAARAGGPLVVLYSRADCRYCETVKRDYLKPLAADPRYARRVVVREIGQDRATPLVDFAGGRTTHAAFAAREKIRLVPVVAFYGPDGRQLAAPIVGALLADFYPTYLERALDQASSALKKP